MAHADWLFMLFGRLHSKRNYTGTGINLATLRRRYGGEVWAESTVGESALFAFTVLPAVTSSDLSKTARFTVSYPDRRPPTVKVG